MTDTRLTTLLKNWDETGVQDRLFERAYNELKAIAHRRLAREHRESDLQATALVNEAYLRLNKGSYESRRHFFGSAARAMEQTLIDDARRAKALRRAGKPARLDSLDLPAIGGVSNEDELLDLHEAIVALEAVDSRKVEVVRSKVFLGLTTIETAAAIGIAVRTVEKDWTLAKAWLRSYTLGPKPASD